MYKNTYRCNHCGKTMTTSKMDKKVPNCCGVPMTKIESKDSNCKNSSKNDSNCNSSDEMGGCCASEDC